ncbi:uncharacterized protein LOC128982384 [Macrosteles quadrilineatus]|uniref:uncharacterized protein LOC128982384 n=1 Tax=Macrosteles quadrilineatus TaxID=74068 RepID=UPI0023E34E8D|nr:uncharacterized protein LOC128982384 [Macrosteles quadrilineatus]
MLDINTKAEYSDAITGMEFHTHKPYASSTFKNNDEIRIPISQQDIITAPFESTLLVKGTVKSTKTDRTEAPWHFVNNAVAFFFDEIRYEIAGIEVDRTKNVGITTTMKNVLSIRPHEVNMLQNACWLGPGEKLQSKEFSFSVPLRLLLGFAEDYRRVIVNNKQELVLLRSASDKNAVISNDASDVSITITGVYWRVPHVNVSDSYRLTMLRMIEKDTTVHIPFRSWELHEYPSLPQTNIHSWTVKTSAQLEKPRYVILAFQEDRKNQYAKDMSSFDHCDLTNIKVYLNSQYFPYDNINGDKTLFYEMFCRFLESYYGRQSTGQTAVTMEKFNANVPLYVVDCSKQNDAIKSGPVDVRVDFETKNAVPASTTAYCLLIHDSHMTYKLLTGSVSKVTV